MNDIDKEILDKADDWHRSEVETQKERERLRHARWVAVGRFFKRMLLGLAIMGLIAVLVVGGYFVRLQCSAANQEERQVRSKMDRLYNETWIECVETLSLDKCKIIQEIALKECLESDSLRSCAKDRISDREEALSHP